MILFPPFQEDPWGDGAGELGHRTANHRQLSSLYLAALTKDRLQQALEPPSSPEHSDPCLSSDGERHPSSFSGGEQRKQPQGEALGLGFRPH